MRQQCRVSSEMRSRSRSHLPILLLPRGPAALQEVLHALLAQCGELQYALLHTIADIAHFVYSTLLLTE
jgi:hypothetical protein